MIKTLAGQVKEFKKDSIITPIFHDFRGDHGNDYSSFDVINY